MTKFPNMFSQGDVDALLSFYQASQKHTKTSEVPELNGSVTTDRVIFHDDNRSGVVSDIIYPKLLDICANPNPAFTGMICRSNQPFAPHVDTVEGTDLNTISLLVPLTWETSDQAPATIMFDQLNATENGPMRIVASGDPEALEQYQKRHPDFREKESNQLATNGHGTFVMSDDLSTYIENPSTVPAVSPLLDFVAPVIRQKFSIKETIGWTVGEGFTWPSRQWHCSGSYSALGVTSKTWLLVKPQDVLK